MNYVKIRILKKKRKKRVPNFGPIVNCCFLMKKGFHLKSYFSVLWRQEVELVRNHPIWPELQRNHLLRHCSYGELLEHFVKSVMERLVILAKEHFKGFL